jgi:hypothetical protein
MYHAFLKAGKIEQVECDLKDVEGKLEKRQATLLFSADSPEEYERKLAKDPNGKLDSQ